MIFKKRILASVAFVWSLAVLSVAAVAVKATAANGGATLDDVQVGERGNLTRIALLCTPACSVDTDDNGEFLLRGVNASVELDLTSRAKNVRSFATVPGPKGSRISIIALKGLSNVERKTCKVAGRDAACIDLFFDQQTPANVVATDRTADRTEQAALNSSERIAIAPPSKKPQTVNLPKPALRDTAEARYHTYASLAAPERLTPPTGAILAKVTPIEPQVEISTPEVSQPMDTNPASLSTNFNLASYAQHILGKSLSDSDCAAADASLQADAWALGAMVDVGYCRAVNGELSDADGIFARLLEYTPDNYQALVGRALIAMQAGEKSVARKYFQDALNALPPMEDSNRIVETMAAL